MRRLHHPIEVRADERQTPRQMLLGGDWRPIRCVQDAWLETGRWWEGDLPTRFYRVEAGGMFDLSVDEVGQWRVEVAWD